MRHFMGGFALGVTFGVVACKHDRGVESAWILAVILWGLLVGTMVWGLYP